MNADLSLSVIKTEAQMRFDQVLLRNREMFNSLSKGQKPQKKSNASTQSES